MGSSSNNMGRWRGVDGGVKVQLLLGISLSELGDGKSNWESGKGDFYKKFITRSQIPEVIMCKAPRMWCPVNVSCL